MKSYVVDLPAIRAAAVRIAGRAHRTPTVTSHAINAIAGRELFFKCENLQRVGAFKFRGALNALTKIPADWMMRGVVTHSSGNHAQAVALAAAMRGIQATIVMPTTAPQVKRNAVAGYGARIVDCEPTLEARETVTASVIEQTGATLIHAYDHPDVIAGQGTVALEIHEQVPGLDAVIAPVGGGGLLSGVTIATRGTAPDCRVFAGEPVGADDAWRSKTTGRHVRTHSPNTIADGLLTTLGQNTFPIVRDLVDDIFLVDDTEIVAAMRLIWERMKLVVEPSAAVPLAAVLSDRFRQLDGMARVGVILSGGNVDLDRFFAAFE